MRNIFKLTFYILIINLFFNLIAFSQTNSNNILTGNFSTNNIFTRQFSQERQLLSVNLLPSHSAIFPPLIKRIVKNIDTFAGLAGININDITFSGIKAKNILNSVKGSFWYIPDISYTFLFNRFVGIELGIGAQSVSYSLNIPKDTVSSLLNGKKLLHNGIEIPASELAKKLKGENIGFKASFVYIPIHLGLKIMSGKTHKTVNTFKLGLEAVIYNIDTENIFSGEKIRSSTIESTFYISYELGWQIDLFPNKNWRVKPYLDFSLFEIGYYIKSANRGIYDEIRNGISRLGDTSSIPSAFRQYLGVFNFNILPSWDDLEKNEEYGQYLKYAKYATSLKIAIFPRFGFTIRF